MPSSVVSAFTSYSTTPSWVTDPFLVQVGPSDNTPFTTFVSNESWQEFPKLPDHCIALWLIHHERMDIGPRWYLFHQSSCPEDHPSYRFYEEFDDWFYKEDLSVWWGDEETPSFVPACLEACEDPLAWIFYVGTDPNDWVGSLIQAIHMEAEFSSQWGMGRGGKDKGNGFPLVMECPLSVVIYL
ncbi:hypothetical protein RSAG8_12098, partial [Rhizoctonia solani AG-8 WAC10335]